MVEFLLQTLRIFQLEISGEIQFCGGRDSDETSPEPFAL
jgi:hypothetical protein